MDPTVDPLEMTQKTNLNPWNFVGGMVIVIKHHIKLLKVFSVTQQIIHPKTNICLSEKIK